VNRVAFSRVAPLCLALLAAGGVQAQPAGGQLMDVSGFIAEVDRNHDGCASRAEWRRAGAPLSSYESLKDDKGCVTVAHMRTVPGPPGIDTNGDGKLSLAELKTFDKTMAPLMAKMKARPVISDGERAAATWAVQNLMSRHEYMHAADLNLEEIDSFWVSRNGAYAKTAAFASPGWVMNGIETVRAAYGQGSRKDAEAARKALSLIDPTVKDTPEFFGAGAEWVMHTSTTPLIEIAGDGQTAQGAWYSPGVGIMPNLVDGKVKLTPVMFWEKYGGDFVKENGQWKIWHLQMAYDFVPGLPAEMVADLNKKLGELAWKGLAGGAAVEAGERMGGELPPGFSKPKYVYPAYSPQRAAVIWPNLPKPYYTWGETHNNCNCDQ
jgi:hypothetical protein